jgi:hypothetical protein
LPEDYNFRLTLLSELSDRRINIEKLMHIDTSKTLEVKDKYLILMTSIIESLAERSNKK